MAKCVMQPIWSFCRAALQEKGGDDDVKGFIMKVSLGQMSIYEECVL